ncbi:MAG: YceI family protein [Bacteroidota bacterium]|nr:YceI family protein [Bacteroidota bacterium]
MLHKKILLICLLFFFISLVAWKKTSTTLWIINENSSLLVNGSTNVNKFSCAISHYDHTDTLQINQSNQNVILTGSLDLNIENFDCHNPMMTHELRKTLKEKEFPMLHIKFLSLSDLPALCSSPKPITGLVEIQLAGTAKRYKVNYQISVDDKKFIHLVGSRDVNFSDFNLTPPKKLGGMVKSKDALSIVFSLKMKCIQ